MIKESRTATFVLNNDRLLGLVLLVGRIFMGGVFLRFGIGKILHTARMQQYMEAHGLPGSLISLAIVVQIAFGVLVIVAYHTRFAALMLWGFTIIATLLFHLNDGGTWKDFAIAGGFLFMIAYGPGPLSLDARIARVRAAKETELPSGRREQMVRT